MTSALPFLSSPQPCLHLALPPRSPSLPSAQHTRPATTTSHITTMAPRMPASRASISAFVSEAACTAFANHLPAYFCLQ